MVLKMEQHFYPKNTFIQHFKNIILLINKKSFRSMHIVTEGELKDSNLFLLDEEAKAIRIDDSHHRREKSIRFQ
jgi:hypothetical protein